MLKWRRESLNSLIEEAIIDAEQRGVKVLSLGLLNQASTSNFLMQTNKEQKLQLPYQKVLFLYFYPHELLLLEILKKIIIK
jgi:hypothetical protein